MDGLVNGAQGVTRLAAVVDEFLARRESNASLRRVERGDLERLRTHRNRSEVRRYLADDREITLEAQESWFLAGGDPRLRIVELRSRGDVLPIGVARVGPGSEVGCDAFELGGGFGALVLELACREVVHAGRPFLTTFVENERGVRLYAQAGFVWDTNASLRWLLRDFGDGLRPRAHAKMVLP